MQMLELISLLCLLQIMKLFILTVLELNMFIKKSKNCVGHKNIKTNIFRIQSNNSIMSGYFALNSLILCLQIKLIGYTSLFLPYDFEKKNNIILAYFKNE